LIEFDHSQQYYVYLCEFLNQIMESTKFIKPAGKTKYLRIDHRTVIEISVDVPDDVAREHFLRNRELNNPNSKKSLVNN